MGSGREYKSIDVVFLKTFNPLLPLEEGIRVLDLRYTDDVRLTQDTLALADSLKSVHYDGLSYLHLMLVI